jgi:hypothetical protein
MMRFSDGGLARCDTRFRVVGRLARLLVALILVGPLAAATSPGGGAVGGADGFEELKKAFLEAAAKKDVPGLFDALEAMELHDSAEKAELLVRVGLSHKDIEVYRESERQLRGLQLPESRAVVVGNALKGKDINLRADCTRILRATQTRRRSTRSPSSVVTSTGSSAPRPVGASASSARSGRWSCSSPG